MVRYLVIGGLVFLSSCASNSLDEDPIDCSITTLSLISTVSDADCGSTNGVILLEVSGGVPPYKYQLDDGTAQTENEFNNLMAGSYTIVISDKNNCSITNSVSVAVTGGFQATATVTNSGCKTSNGSISIQASSGVEPYQYKLLGGTQQSNPVFGGLSSGEYEVIITDASGCEFSILKKVNTGISYNSSIKSIIANSCATTNCHDGSTSQTNFTNFSNVQSNASSIKSRTQSGSMPKDGSLTQAQKDAIACWVDDGAKDN